ncbi:MAG: RNA-binding protein [Lentimicrobiaceae bacterium]|jgi:RNA recognition motif-containing protein|nr:RNA-binding protein [Lentimicrobiaceae bacterium]MDG1902060.1 RNA-binding protein [Bacteroidales bacterium]MDG2081500.1 RNA-binding protein [Bacteroidales bacterium]|tara:strand:+ start:18197 stop:18448 length:252 start_codon:yes stop_codon:yes gene_type:complete
MNIYVGNLNYRVEENEIKELFEEFGEVETCKIITDKFSGRSKGFGFVTMDDDAAGSAIENLNGKSYKDRDLVVNEAKPKRESY